MQQHELRSPRGAKKARKRVGRGNASGHGTYSGRGLKGQQSRSGYSIKPGFEGGQTSLIRRLPRRRGFRNRNRVAYTPVNLKDLSRLPAGSDVTPESLREAGIVRTLRHPIKILSDGDLEGSLAVRVHRVSASARTKIEAAGGSVEELTPRPPRAEEAKAPEAEERAEPASQEQDDIGSETNESTDAS